MTREEEIEKAWESDFKNIIESIDSERTKDDVASMFFELGCRWSDENKSVDWQQVRIQAAIAVMQGICSNDEVFVNMENSLIVRHSLDLSELLVSKLKGE